MNFLNILSDGLKIIGGILPIPGLKEVAEAISPDKIPTEKQAEVQLALFKHQENMAAFEIEKLRTQIDEMKISVSESLAMIQSSDKFTSRARPMGVYAATFITVMLAVGMMFEIKLDTGAIVSLLVPLWGSASFYTYNRTQEKLGK